MKANELLAYFLELAPWVDPCDTVDRIIIGDRNKAVNRLLVVWQASLETIRYAVDSGYDAIMAHEPTFYFHSEELARAEALPDSSARKKAALEKKRLIESAGLVIIRNHDVWDRFPGCGIPWAWAALLGLSGAQACADGSGYLHAYAVPPVSALRLSRQVKERLPYTGSREIQLFGNADKIITRLGIGTGCFCDLDSFADMGCDGIVVCDDGFSYWRDVSLAVDLNTPVIRVFHSTSEDSGILKLAEYMRREFPEIQTDYLPFDPKVTII